MLKILENFKNFMHYSKGYLIRRFKQKPQEKIKFIIYLILIISFLTVGFFLKVPKIALCAIFLLIVFVSIYMFYKAVDFDLKKQLAQLELIKTMAEIATSKDLSKKEIENIVNEFFTKELNEIQRSKEPFTQKDIELAAAVCQRYREKNKNSVLNNEDINKEAIEYFKKLIIEKLGKNEK